MRESSASDGMNNLYVAGIPKELGADKDTVRRVFARFGKIVSFKLVNSPKFATNLVYVAYKYPS